ncbi:DUF1212-domain-containing protein [Trametopsis cervina]|nr:DUF1212-domain-containing protein [Trametopsis cervina]
MHWSQSRQNSDSTKRPSRTPSENAEDHRKSSTSSSATNVSNTAYDHAKSSPAIPQRSSFGPDSGAATTATLRPTLADSSMLQRRSFRNDEPASPSPAYNSPALKQGFFMEQPTERPKPTHLLGTYKQRVAMMRRQSREIVEHVEPYQDRVDFILILAQCLLSFGAPSHRIESQLESAAAILNITVGFVHLPNLIIANLMETGTVIQETRFVRAGGRIALTNLHRVHLVYRDVLHDKVGVAEGTDRLRKLLRARPIYPVWIRCVFAFVCASIICTTAFGGSLLDMFIGGIGAAILQYLGLSLASKSAIYANIYEITMSILVSFVAKALGTIRGNYFCYSAISSAGVVLILPGFTILVSALELTSRNIMCGSLRMVYAFIYTLFLGFGLSFGSDLYLVISKYGRQDESNTQAAESEFLHGAFHASNVSSDISVLTASFTFLDSTDKNPFLFKGCYRNPAWPWYRQQFPWWTLLFLVPLYATCSSVANLQRVRSVQLPVMVLFSCASYATTKIITAYVTDHVAVVSAFGAIVVGLCGNIWSRLGGGTAFTSMITGVLFLVPSAIGSGGGLISNYRTAAQQYSDTFQLGLRMIQVASGVTIGLFVAQILVYALGRRKNAAYFAF